MLELGGSDPFILLGTRDVAASAQAAAEARLDNTAIKPGDEASQEEFFGPVAQVCKVGSEEEAVASPTRRLSDSAPT